MPRSNGGGFSNGIVGSRVEVVLMLEMVSQVWKLGEGHVKLSKTKEAEKAEKRSTERS